MAGAIFFASCKKNNNSSDPKPSHQFEIDFNSSTIDINKVDSVTITLKSAGNAAVTKKMQKGPDIYHIDNIGLGNSTVEVSIRVHTPKSINTQGTPTARVFVFENTVTTGFIMAGPSDVKKDSWKPRVTFTDDIHKVELTIGESAEDPYFLLKADKPQDWVYAYLEKDARTNNNLFIDGVVWEGYSDVPSDPLFVNGSNTIINTTHFAPYASRMTNKSWDKGEIFLQIIQNNAANDVIFYHIYNDRK